MGETTTEIKPCERCGKDCAAHYIGTGTGGMHPKCYHLSHPPLTCKSFGEVLWNCDDSKLAYAVLMDLVPEDIQAEVVRRFNEGMAERYQRRIMWYLDDAITEDANP